MVPERDPGVRLEEVNFYEGLGDDEFEEVYDSLETLELDYLERVESDETVEPVGQHLEDHLTHFMGKGKEFIVAKQNGTIHYLGRDRSALERL